MDEEFLRKREKADHDYRKTEYRFHMAAMERGRKAQDCKCQKCGDVGCLPCIYSIASEKEVDGRLWKWKRWVYAVTDCDCVKSRRYGKAEKADEEEIKEVFGK